MEYSISQLSKISNVSTRTLRYYDEINLLKPLKTTPSGYRIYGEKEVDLLLQILFFKELQMELNEIKKILHSPDFDELNALRSHLKKMIGKKERTEALIENLEKIIFSKERKIKMDNKEKFNGFKQDLIDENERKYGSEIRGKYGNEAVDNSNKKFMNMDESQFKKFKSLEQEILSSLKAAIESKISVNDELAKKIYDMHKEWLCFTHKEYNKIVHAEIAKMYVDDLRFKEYYEKAAPGAAEFLRDVILFYTQAI